jgi:hypothetical protein
MNLPISEPELDPELWTVPVLVLPAMAPPDDVGTTGPETAVGVVRLRSWLRVS